MLRCHTIPTNSSPTDSIQYLLKVTMLGHNFSPLTDKLTDKSKYNRGIKVNFAAANNGQLLNHDFVDETLAE